jgi:hypothetical protein
VKDEDDRKIDEEKAREGVTEGRAALVEGEDERRSGAAVPRTRPRPENQCGRHCLSGRTGA